MTSYIFDIGDLERYIHHDTEESIWPIEPLNNAVHPLFRRQSWLGVDLNEILFDKVKEFALKSFDKLQDNAYGAQLRNLTYTRREDLTGLTNMLRLGAAAPAGMLSLPRKLATWRSEGLVLTRSECTLMGEAEYNELLPMLRLASRLLDLALPVLYKIYNGRQAWVEGREVLPDWPEPSLQQLEEFDRTVLSSVIANHVLLYQLKNLLRASAAYAITGLVYMKPNHRLDREWVQVRISREMVQACRRAESQTATSDFFRYAFMPAVSLVHEAAHVVAKHSPVWFERLAEERSLRGVQQLADQRVALMMEPFFGEVDTRNRLPELGRVLETYLFGNLVQVINSYGFSTTPLHSFIPRYLKKAGSGQDEYDEGFLSVDGTCLLHLFHEPNWVGMDRSPLQIRITPCRSQLLGAARTVKDFDDDLEVYATGEEPVESKHVGRGLLRKNGYNKGR